MNIVVNGKARNTGPEADMPLLAFLSANDVDPKLVAVAINGDVIPRAAYGGATVREGDSIEIVRMVGGGSA